MQLHDRMRDQAEAWRSAGDKRYLFLACYAMMTEAMLTGLTAGRFRDQAWVTRLLDRFAEYYFEALDAYAADPGSAPAVWKLAHDQSRFERLHVFQHVMLGINAHINFDLVLTMHELLRPDWPGMDDKKRAARLADHETVNEVIAETIDRVQDEVIERESPWMEVVDRLMGRMDEWLLAELIRGWRQEVWQAVGGLLAATTEEEKEELRRETEQRALHKAEQILRF